MLHALTDKRLFTPIVVLLVAAGMAASMPAGSQALVAPGPVTANPDFTSVLPLARRELRRKPYERRGNNVPRYHKGKGRVAPYSIKAFWCVAFATWVWAHSGITSYLGTDLLWKSRDGTEVGIQVKDMTRWAKRTGRWSYRAKPGWLIAYGTTHMGIVEKADRRGRAVRSIEGNLSNRVKRTRVPMDSVSGYISPNKLTPSQYVRRNSVRADVD